MSSRPEARSPSLDSRNRPPLRWRRRRAWRSKSGSAYIGDFVGSDGRLSSSTTPCIRTRVRRGRIVSACGPGRGLCICGVFASLAMAGRRRPLETRCDMAIVRHSPRTCLAWAFALGSAGNGSESADARLSELLGPPVCQAGAQRVQVLAKAFGPPTRCHATDPWSAGRPARSPCIRPGRECVPEPCSSRPRAPQSAGPEVCRAGSRARCWS